MAVTLGTGKNAPCIRFDPTRSASQARADLRPQPPPAATHNPVVGRDRRILELIASCAGAVQAEVRRLDGPEQLPSSLRGSAHDLVLVCGRPAALGATKAVAHVRKAAGATPCMIVTFVHPWLAQVTVSDTEDGPTSTQVMDRENLARLPERLITRDARWRRGT
jgi:hypothetical protein